MSMLLLRLVDDKNGIPFRGTIAPDGEEVYSVYDCMTRGCEYKTSEGKNRGAAARNEFKRMTAPTSVFRDKILSLCYDIRFPGFCHRIKLLCCLFVTVSNCYAACLSPYQTATLLVCHRIKLLRCLFVTVSNCYAACLSQYHNATVVSLWAGAAQTTPCMTIVGLTSFMGYLGNKVGAEFREILNDTFRQVMGGDRKLIEVINANSVSDSPIQKAFQASLLKDPVPPILEELCLGKKRERDDLLFDVQMAERQAALQERKAALEERKLKHASNMIEHAKTAMGAINALKDWTNVDERTKLQVEDHMKNVMFNAMAVQPSNLTITDGTQPTQVAPVNNQTAGITISVLANELGFKCSDGDLQRIGRAMAKAYRATYKSDPPKHTQYVGGGCIPVNSYMERDRAMMEQVIRSAMKSK